MGLQVLCRQIEPVRNSNRMYRGLFLKRALRSDLGTRHVTMSGAGDTRSKIGSGTSERTPKICCMIPSLFAKDSATQVSHITFALEH
ncbi:MAG TPA: hypothetical protein DCZ04_01415 [Syntrophorhabdus aromaticivorans]|nr:hypothetical protein [Syntrophorhabdus aromaticivorans]